MSTKMFLNLMHKYQVLYFWSCLHQIYRSLIIVLTWKRLSSHRKGKFCSISAAHKVYGYQLHANEHPCGLDTDVALPVKIRFEFCRLIHIPFFVFCGLTNNKVVKNLCFINKYWGLWRLKPIFMLMSLWSVDSKSVL